MDEKTVYIWANPLTLTSYLDHTWVTTYNPINTCPPDTSKGNYWYCWGICHMTGQQNPTARLLHSGQANMNLANCISTPEDTDDHAGITSWYARYGVCHQVANRILFSTATESEKPLLVDGANGFWLSHLLYGNYGGKKGNWEDIQRQCGIVRIMPNLMDLSPMFSMLHATLGTDFSDGMLEPLRSIQQKMIAHKEELEARVEMDEMSVEEFATAINQMLTESVPLLAEIIGFKYSRIVFGVDPGEKVYLIDEEIAARSNL